MNWIEKKEIDSNLYINYPCLTKKKKTNKIEPENNKWNEIEMMRTEKEAENSLTPVNIN